MKQIVYYVSLRSMGMKFNGLSGSNQFSANWGTWIVAAMVIKFKIFFLIIFFIAYRPLGFLMKDIQKAKLKKMII